MYKKSGVSLIVLVITITVMIILSSTVILNISSADGQISAAQRADMLTDMTTFIDEFNMQLSKDPRMDLDSFSSTEKGTLIQYLPSIENVKTPTGVLYTDVIAIQKGKLVLNDEKNLLEREEKEVILELIKEISK